MSFFFNDSATTEIYTLSLHDALPISLGEWRRAPVRGNAESIHAGTGRRASGALRPLRAARGRPEEHTSELQSQSNLVCRLLLEKKKKKILQYQKHNTHLYNKISNNKQ